MKVNEALRSERNGKVLKAKIDDFKLRKICTLVLGVNGMK